MDTREQLQNAGYGEDEIDELLYGGWEKPRIKPGEQTIVVEVSPFSAYKDQDYNPTEENKTMANGVVDLNGKVLVGGKAGTVTVTKLKFSYGVTKNMGNYESIRVEEGLEVTIDGSVNMEAVIKTAREQLKAKVDAAIKTYK